MESEWELGSFDNSTGEKIPSTTQIRTKDRRIKPTNYSGAYRFISPDAGGRVYFYNADGTFNHYSSIAKKSGINLVAQKGATYAVMLYTSDISAGENSYLY